MLFCIEAESLLHRGHSIKTAQHAGDSSGTCDPCIDGVVWIKTPGVK